MAKNSDKTPRVGVFYLRPVPLALKLHFKAECAARDVTMLEMFLEVMRNAKRLVPMLIEWKRQRELDQGDTPPTSQK